MSRHDIKAQHDSDHAKCGGVEKTTKESTPFWSFLTAAMRPFVTTFENTYRHGGRKRKWEFLENKEENVDETFTDCVVR